EAGAVDHGAQRSIIRDGVHDGAAYHLNAGGQDFERGNNVFGRAQHIEDIDVGTAQVFFEHEGKLDFNAHVGKLFVLNNRSVFKDLVFKNRAVVRFGNAGGFLHHLRGQANLAANEPTARLNFALDPLA